MSMELEAETTINRTEKSYEYPWLSMPKTIGNYDFIWLIVTKARQILPNTDS